MRVLLIHTDRFSFRVTGATSVAGAIGELAEELRDGSSGDALVCFCAAEKVDEDDVASVVSQAVEVFAGHARRIDATTVWVYPYAHLASDLASPRVATRVLDSIVAGLECEDALEVRRAPFGYYKAFDISCKGHPLSELGQTIRPGGQAADGAPTTDAAEKERDLQSDWLVVTPDSSVVPADQFDMGAEPEFARMVAYERSGSRAVEEPPPHIALMREHQLLDYEPAADPGNFRWYPKGQLIKRLLETYVSERVRAYGGRQVETPLMHDYEHPQLAAYLNRFPARQYILRSDRKEYFLRFAACFGQYMIQHDMQLSYRNLPCRMYELTHYSFRREQTGELAGLRRLRTFTMPDLHTMAVDEDQAREEFLQQVDLSLEVLQALEVDTRCSVRFVRDFWDRDPAFAAAIAARVGQPVLVERWDQRFFYFTCKFEANFVDSQGKAACLSTVQIDVENMQRFGVTYVGADGERHHPLLLHTSASGSIDRVLYAILESQAMRMQHSQKAHWPYWLAPTQVRLIPVSEDQAGHCLELVDGLPARVDVDDRDATLGRRIRDAEKEWVPLIVVVGAREVGGGTLSLRPRGGKQITVTTEELCNRIASLQGEMPSADLNQPIRLSERPVFVG